MTYVVAEIGSNHDGQLDRALLLIKEAATVGADAVKFQCLPSLPRRWVPDLKEYANEVGVEMSATPFDVDAVQMLADIGVPWLKIASVEIVHLDLIRTAAKTGLPLVISTGMANLTEIQQALEAAKGVDVTLLQCVVSYPALPEQINLRAMVTLRKTFLRPVGLSDHTLSTTIPAAATALGASVVEKHLTLDRSLPGPDHPFALEPYEFAAMVRGVREVERALGDGRKVGPQEGEMIELRGRRLRWG